MEELCSNPAVVVAFATGIAAITNGIVQILVNYKPNKKISNIDTKVNESRIANNEEHKIIMEKLEEHSRAVEVFMCEKDINLRFSNIARDAIEYISSIDLSICIDRFCSTMGCFVEDIAIIGIQNISKEQLTSKLEVLRNDIKNAQSMHCSYIQEKDISCMRKIFNSFQKEILDVYSDNMNSKLRRIIIKSEDFTHTIIKEGINIFYKGEQNDRRN